MDSQTLVKICGLSDLQSVEAAVGGGADYIGLVFFEKSPRHVSLATAARLGNKARELSRDVAIVALMVDPTDDEIADVCQAIAPSYIQLHGTESRERVQQVQKQHRVKVIKAVAVATRGDVDAGLNVAGAADVVLFDAKPAPGGALPGGNGLAFDWTILEDVKCNTGFMLAGGLTDDTVADAIALTGASAVDVSSGVETRPGTKDPELIRRFIKAAKAAKKGS
ncbi:MAG: phosphoribosylanthranilate isomerase [Alphaproteobacteria bacterium]|nr:phosphoribosylanthranilate isomerase [Alphaproteobacteria bacterium]